MEHPPYCRWLTWGAALFTTLLALAWAQRPDGRLHLYALNTPGEALLIQTPSGRWVLIDGGSDPTLLATELGRLLPFWQRGLAALILTDPESSDLPGQVAALARYRPDLVLAPTDLSDSGRGGEWRRLVRDLRVPARALQAGTRLNLGAGVALQVLALNPGEAGGAVLLIRYGATQLLVHSGGPTGDSAAAQVVPPVTLLIYPWQRELATPLIAHLRPQAILFSSRYADDEPVLLSYTERRRYSPALYHEKNDGTVELISDGRRAWIETTP
ncbi:hypothetical protein [Candidatus Oscillochloris fontis]|uniref:hypothetical protein n=1 Tax=Candidatus Oscillochloris fontis TaxID=2496868 RepID=UPI001EE7D10A|nr:hypothetical protein [Candidatus Oscillochloris fontis]